MTHFVALGFWTHFHPVRAKVIDDASLLTFGVKVAALLGVAWILYQGFERHTARMRGWLRDRLLAHT